MANVFNILKPKADLTRNAFDLSQRHIFSAKCGQILPVMAIECIPGDYHEINLLSLARTFPVKTDAFSRMKLNFDFVYVPYQQLWRDWNDFILQNTEQFSSLQVGSTLPVQVPSIALTDLLCCVLERYVEFINSDPSSPANADRFGYNLAENALRMLDLLGYGSFYSIIGYFNSLPSSESLSNRLSTAKQMIVANYGATSLNPYQVPDFPQLKVPVRINLWRVLAYQKACNDFYRSNQYTAARPRLFNLDEFDIDINTDTQVGRVYSMFAELWYRMYKKDMFTGLLPSPQFGDVSSVELSQLDSFRLGVVGDNSFAVNNKDLRTTNAISVDYVSPVGLQTPSSSTAASNQANFTFLRPNNNSLNPQQISFDVYQLRKAEALQKWKEDRLRAGNKNRDISNVIYGTTSRYLADKYCDFITSFDASMTIDEVVNMSAQGDVELGDIGGKSVGSCTGKLNYKTSEFGVLLCLFSVQPISEYDAVSLDKNNTLIEPFDYFEPHFENLGFDSINGYQLSVLPKLSSVYNENLEELRKTLGFAPRFLNYKTAIDKVHGQFMSGAFTADGSNMQSGEFAAWSTPRVDIENLKQGEGFTTNFLYVNPKILDPIFVSQSDSSQSTDQFLVNANFVVNSVRNMSVLGLPRW